MVVPAYLVLVDFSLSKLYDLNVSLVTFYIVTYYCLNFDKLHSFIIMLTCISIIRNLIRILIYIHLLQFLTKRERIPSHLVMPPKKQKKNGTEITQSIYICIYLPR